jgi:hypothetical protein
VLSPLVGIPVATPNPVLGADDKTHLPYEIVLMNMAAGSVGLKKVETLNADSGAVLAILEGPGLAQMLRLNGGANSAGLPAGGSGVLFMDVALDGSVPIPRALKQRYEITVTGAPVADGAGDRDPTPQPPQHITFMGDVLELGPPALVIAPPLKGSRWVVGGGCCTPYSYHRGATLPINGGIRVAERFAIDFVQLNDKNMLNAGPQDQLSSYAFFGDEIYSVADGTVVEVVDGLTEQVQANYLQTPRYRWLRATTSLSISAKGASPFMRICNQEA